LIEEDRLPFIMAAADTVTGLGFRTVITEL